MTDASANYVSGRDSLSYLICPYDKTHQIWSQTYLNHIYGCRRNYILDCKKRKLPVDMWVCRYNAEHHLPRSQIDKHQENCPNKYDMLKFKSTYSKTQTYGGAAKYNPELSKDKDEDADYSWEPFYEPPDNPPLTRTLSEKEKLGFAIAEPDSDDVLYDPLASESTSDEEELFLTLMEPDSDHPGKTFQTKTQSGEEELRLTIPEQDSDHPGDPSQTEAQSDEEKLCFELAEPDSDDILYDSREPESPSDEEPTQFFWRTY